MEEFNILFSLALGLVAGLFMSRLMKPLGLPAVTSYLVAGILIGPFVLGRLGITGLFSSLEELSTMGSLVQDVALGFIAFAIGNEFKLSDLKHPAQEAQAKTADAKPAAPRRHHRRRTPKKPQQQK